MDARKVTAQPKVGRTAVFRFTEQAEWEAAIITGLVGDGHRVHLTVFSADAPPRNMRNVAPDGLSSSVPVGEDPAPNGTWRYP